MSWFGRHKSFPQTVHVVEIITGGVAQEPAVFATARGARNRLLEVAKAWQQDGGIVRCHSTGNPLTPKEAASAGAFTDKEGDTDCIWRCVYVRP